MPPTAVETTGNPVAMASTMESGRPSDFDDRTKTSLAERSPGTSCRSPAKTTRSLTGSGAPVREQMETLADAITSIDYYLESMEEHKPIGDAVLEVAEESLAELGYPVMRAPQPA